MLTYGGVGLRLPTHQIQSYVEANLTVREASPWLRRAWPGRYLHKFTAEAGYRAPAPVRLGELRWPRDASRWASAHFVAAKSDVDQITPLAYGPAGGGITPLPLVMSAPGSPGNETISTLMYLLPPSPLGVVDAPGGSGGSGSSGGYADGFYLLTLVDERYYWWDVGSPDFGIGCCSAGVTWGGMVAACGQALGETIGLDPIPGSYLSPSPDFNAEGRPLPVVLDAIMANVGLRLTRGWDGTLHGQGFAGGSSGLDSINFANAGRARRAGGQR